MTPASITTGTFVLRNASGASVAAAVAYNSSTQVATLTPSQALASSATYTATVNGGSAGVKDLAGNALAADRAWSFTTAASAPPPPPPPPPPSGAISLFSATAAPAAFATNDPSSVELGMKFRSDVAGTVTGVRFFKGSTTTGTHTATLWSASGTRLATATFTNETRSGWQQVNFSTPVAITANTVYVVSYHTNVGNYAYTAAYFASKGVDNGPLHAPATGAVAGGNGVYRYATSSVFPASTFNANNYWVDVVFVAK